LTPAETKSYRHSFLVILMKRILVVKILDEKV
jgi:hypothetical protein